ncbi:MAG: carbohydrate porin [Balneolaceae bacterium]|nr:carbohydrate porin [Balneolaceae bacterium]
MERKLFPAVLILVTVFYQLQPAEAQNRFIEGVDPTLTYTVDLLSNIRGGRDTGVRFMDNLDLELRIDMKKSLGIDGGVLYLYGLANQGGDLSADLVGDFQVASNIEADESWRFYEIWYHQMIRGLRSSILVGLYDLNSEFDVNDTGQLFLNSSHGIGAAFGNSGVLGPSIFPLTSFGGRLKWNIWEGLVLKTAVLDGIPSNPANTSGTKILFRENDGLLLATELSFIADGKQKSMGTGRHGRMRRFLSRDETSEYRFKVAVGGWLYTEDREGWIDADGLLHRDRGIYLLGDVSLYRESVESPQGLSGFFRFGLANEAINRLGGYAGGGLVYTGLFRKRSNDKLGIAVAYAVNSSRYRDSLEAAGEASEKAETGIEATYLFALGDHLNLQWDMQYVINPNMEPSLDNALILGLRTGIAF